MTMLQHLPEYSTHDGIGTFLEPAPADNFSETQNGADGGWGL
jgi:hypothetical protein